MDADRHIWQIWARFLHRWGITNWVAALLEAAGPLSLLGAQLVYIGQPLFNQVSARNHLEALARLLEDPTQTHAFIEVLREVPQRESS